MLMPQVNEFSWLNLFLFFNFILFFALISMNYIFLISTYYFPTDYKIKKFFFMI